MVRRPHPLERWLPFLGGQCLHRFAQRIQRMGGQRIVQGITAHGIGGIAGVGRVVQIGELHPRQNTGGQQQRLCIARALAVKPEVILMDEPTSALDPISTSKIEDLVMDIKKDYTIVMVTHNMQQAVRVSDTTVFFLLGEIVESGATGQMFSMPKDKRTEDYITGRFG